MASIDASIEVEVPLSRAYNQWTQFESFPLFMEGVREVRQVDDTHLHWVVEVGGRVKEWDAEIVSQEPDHRVAWHSTGGTPEATARGLLEPGELGGVLDEFVEGAGCSHDRFLR